MVSTSSSFKSIESMITLSAYEEQINTIAKLAFTSADEIYFNKKEEIEYIRKEDGMMVKDENLSSNWTLTTNSKLIGSYLCYEGILKRTFINRKGETKIEEIIAWFAPQLPYPYGPKNFHGLLGLILELHENKTVYSAKNIELIRDDQKIYFPKGKTISKEEYEKKLESSLGGVIIGKKREKEKNAQ
jgi:GLPGLI family protein